MYLDYWELQRPPFGNVPDSHLFFESPQHEEALFRLLYAVKQKKGVAMLTGEVGAGKTTVSKTFLSRLANENYDVQTITNPALDSVDLIRAILLIVLFSLPISGFPVSVSSTLSSVSG